MNFLLGEEQTQKVLCFYKKFLAQCICINLSKKIDAALDPSTQYFMQFNYTSQLGGMFQQKECEFWDKLQASPEYQNSDLQEYSLCYFQNCIY